jgi:hypothetical protein
VKGPKCKIHTLIPLRMDQNNDPWLIWVAENVQQLLSGFNYHFIMLVHLLSNIVLLLINYIIYVDIIKISGKILITC